MNNKFGADRSLFTKETKTNITLFVLVVLCWMMTAVCLLVVYMPKVGLDRVLLMPLSFLSANTSIENLKFTVKKSTNYCLKLEKDQMFPSQNGQLNSGSVNFEDIGEVLIEWKIRKINDGNYISQGTMLPKTASNIFVGNHETGILMDCFKANKNQYILELVVNKGAKVTDLDRWPYRLVIEEDVINLERDAAKRLVAEKAFYVLLIMSSILTLLFLYRLVKRNHY